MTINVSGYEFVTVEADFITVYTVVWRRYRVVTPGVMERLLDDNPHLAKIHKTTPFLPVGTPIRIPIDLDILKRAPQPKTLVRWWETVKGKTQRVLIGQQQSAVQENAAAPRTSP